jgi:hypothetical protein
MDRGVRGRAELHRLIFGLLTAAGAKSNRDKADSEDCVFHGFFPV